MGRLQRCGRAAAGGEHAVLRGEEEGREEDQRLQDDDDAAGGAVEEIADIGADEAGQRADRDADHDQPGEAVGEQVGGGARRHHHGDDQEGADRLQRRHRAGGQQGEEHDLAAAVGLRPIERAWFSSKKVTIRSFHFTSRMASETTPMMASCSVSSGVIGQDVAEHDGLDVHRGRRQRHHEQAEAEEAR